MDIEDLWISSVPDYTNDALARNHWHRHIDGSHLELAIGVVDLLCLMVKRATAALEQPEMSRASNEKALHVRLDEFGSVPSAAQFQLLNAFAISPVRSLRCISGAFKVLDNGHIGITRRCRFCTAVPMEIALRATEVLVAEISARKQVPMLDEPNTIALSSLEQILILTSRLSPIACEVSGRQCNYHTVLASIRMKKIDFLAGEHTV